MMKVKSISFGVAGLILGAMVAHGDEHLFGYVRGAETLPKGHFDAYQFVTARVGKPAGQYRAWDFDTEVEYGITDQLQVGISTVQHYFDFKGVDELDDGSFYRFGGLEGSVKYRIKSPFKDGYGLTFRTETGFLRYDDVGGIIQKEYFVAPQMIVQKNYLDDTLIFSANTGIQLAWGKQPAEQYDHELALEGALGGTYRFAPNWFFGLETHLRSEYPMFDFGNHEHTVLFGGPALHYGAQRWWATLSWAEQLWGAEVDSVVPDKAYAEEARREFRLKIGFNF
ncbi:MAG TPA: DUF6662 family protein [Candidatus Limnocylindria bacterium]|jgi:hypothetical protein|nr:DUF6662 family protein [Candidatus Limnocylindria bacterium]